MSRLPDWEARLCAYLAEVEARPYEWGQHDCAMFGAGVVLATTGHDFGAVWRGKYTSAASVAKMLRRRGFEGIEGPFTQALGEPVAPLLCRRGDVVSDGKSIGLLWHAGGPVALFVGAEGEREGLVSMPVSTLVRGWCT
jgi:hypothetical protein